MNGKRIWRRCLIGTTPLLVAAALEVSCGATDDKSSLARDSGTFGTGGNVASASTGGGAGPSSGDTGTGGELVGSGGSGAPTGDVCGGEAAVYEASWREETSEESPSPRLSHSMAATADGVILFGGGTLLMGGQDDTWVWEQGEWQESSNDTSPPSRAGHDMASAEGSVFMFGGDGGDLLNDIWRYAGDAWDELCADDTCGEPPAARSGLALSYDAAREKLVLFGGFDGDVALQDTWEWDQEDGWRQVCGDDCSADFCCEPAPRHDHRMIYDTVNERIVMFGGTNDATEFDDLWAYDADGWHSIDAEGPSARAGHTFAFDPVHGLALMFGGMQRGRVVADDAWIFDVSSGSWSPLQPSGDAPLGREFAALAFDAQNGEFVMFGGGDSGQYQDTWTLRYELSGCLGAGGAAGGAGAPGSGDPTE